MKDWRRKWIRSEGVELDEELEAEMDKKLWSGVG